MKIFIDSADIEEIKKYISWGVCDGVTTNPTTFYKLGISGQEGEIKNKILEIARLIDPLPLSVEVTSEIPEEIISQAKEYSTWASNIVIKIPVTDSKGNSLLGVIKKLVQEGIIVNVTLVMNFNQAILAVKAISSGTKNLNEKPHFISIFAGRITEEQGIERAFQVIKEARLWIDFHKFSGVEIIIASIRSPENVEYFSKTGGHVMTIPPEVIPKSLLAARTKEGVIRFMEDAKKTT